jgi:hypothetical protein
MQSCGSSVSAMLTFTHTTAHRNARDLAKNWGVVSTGFADSFSGEFVADVGIGESVLEGHGWGHFDGFPNGTDGALNGDGVSGGDLIGDVASTGAETFVFHDLGHDPQAQRSLCGDSLLGPHERPTENIAEWNTAVQHANGLERRNDSTVGMGIEERRFLGADHDVAFIDEVLATTGAHPLNSSNNGLPHFVMTGAQAESGVNLVPHILVLPPSTGLDVDPRTEGLLAVGLENRHVNVVGITDEPPNLCHFLGHCLGKGIELVGAVQRDRCNMIGHFKLDGFIRHLQIMSHRWQWARTDLHVSSLCRPHQVQFRADVTQSGDLLP